MNDVIKTMIERRSCKKFKSEQIKDEDLNLILEAGKYAANGKGMQSAIMVVVQDKETRDYLSRINAKVLGREGIDPFYNAPTVIVVLADRNMFTCVEDGSLVMGNLMLAAYSLGIGSCWIHRAREEFETEEGKALLKKWGIEGDYIGVGHCILGYPDMEYPEPKKRKDNFVYRV